MGADLFESYSGSIIAAATLGASMATGDAGLAYIGLPFLIAAVGVIASLVGTFMVRTEEDATQEDLLGTLRRSTWSASALVLALAAIVVPLSGVSFTYWFIILVGLVAGNGIAFFTEYYTAYSYKPTQGIAEKSETGSATLIIEGLAVGMVSTVAPVLIIAIAILISLMIGAGAGDGSMAAGLYAVALSGVGMLSTLVCHRLGRSHRVGADGCLRPSGRYPRA